MPSHVRGCNSQRVTRVAAAVTGGPSRVTLQALHMRDQFFVERQAGVTDDDGRARQNYVVQSVS